MCVYKYKRERERERERESERERKREREKENHEDNEKDISSAKAFEHFSTKASFGLLPTTSSMGSYRGAEIPFAVVLLQAVREILPCWAFFFRAWFFCVPILVLFGHSDYLGLTLPSETRPPDANEDAKT